MMFDRFRTSVRPLGRFKAVLESSVRASITRPRFWRKQNGDFEERGSFSLDRKMRFIKSLSACYINKSAALLFPVTRDIASRNDVS